MRDHLQATDPALARLRGGWRMLVVFSVCLATGYAMAHLLGQPIMFGLTYGGMVGLLVGLTVAGPTPGRLAVRCVWGVPAFLIALLCAIEVQPYRILALIVAAAAAVVQLSAPAFFGEFGQDSGVMLFAGFLSGVLVPLPLSKMHYIVPIVIVAAIAAAVVQVLLCRMRPETGLVHIERGFLTRTRYVLRRAARLVAAQDGTRATRALCGEMIRLNEAAMLVDGYLANSGSSSRSAARLHRLVFDTELAAHALGRSIVQICRTPLPEEVCTHLLAALADLDRGGRRHDDALPASTAPLLNWLARHEDDSRDPEHEQLVSTLYRIVAVLGDLHRVSDAWTTSADDDLEAEIVATSDCFTTPVELVAGKLPGTNLLAGRVLDSGGMTRPWNVWSNPKPQLRVAAQMLITLMIAVPLGDALNGYRFYWAVIGALIVLSNTDSPHDRMRKTVKRVVGTLVGGFLGIGFAQLVGVHHPMVTVMLLVLALTIGAYAISAYYSVWAGALAFALIQLYSFTGGYEDSVVVLRAGENALGAVVATLVALVVLPIATRTLLRHAQATHVHSLATFVRESGAVWSGSAGADGTREQARAVDQAAHELHRFSRSLVRLPGSAGRGPAEEIRAMLRTAAVCAREMSVGSGRAVLSAGQRQSLLRITENLSDSIDGLGRFVADSEQRSDTGNRTGTKDSTAAPIEIWVRQADDIQRLQRDLAVSPANTRLRHALHYLGHLDDVLGDLAARLDIPVHGSEYRIGARLISRELFATQAQLVTLGHSAATAGSVVAGRPAEAVGQAAAATGWPAGSGSRAAGAAGWPAGSGSRAGAAAGWPAETARRAAAAAGWPVGTGGEPAVDARWSAVAGGGPAATAESLGTPGESVAAGGSAPWTVAGMREWPQSDAPVSATGRRIAGQVLGGTGHPVPDVVLTLIDQRGQQISRAIGDAGGGYRIDVPATGSYVLIVSANGYGPVAVTVQPGPGQHRQDITLLGSAEVSGVVRRAGRGAPLANTTVTLTDSRGEVVDVVITAPGGVYVCGGLVAGDYTLVAHADGMRPAATTLTVPDSGRLRSDIEMTPSSALTGAVRTDAGAVPNAQVTVLDTTGRPIARARTDEDGRYRVPDLAEGRYTVITSGYAPATSRVRVSGDRIVHDVTLGHDESR